MDRAQREQIARKRTLNILRSHGVANARTLEQKISDAGPSPQRVDPHVLTPIRAALVDEGIVTRESHANGTWYHLTSESNTRVTARLNEQVPIWLALQKSSLNKRIGQTLEIATYRALLQLPRQYSFFGAFTDLDEHDDKALYSKQEPPSHISGRSIPGKKKLDFLLHHPTAGWLGLECKNVREWLYPQQTEIVETLRKCTELDVIPVIIARRIPYATFRLMHTCGVILHQCYNQLYPSSAQDIGKKAAHKDNLGYHDIRFGNQPDVRLSNFVLKHLCNIAEASKKRYDEYKDLLAGYSSGELDYPSFAARVSRRERGLDEDYGLPDDIFDPSNFFE